MSYPNLFNLGFSFNGTYEIPAKYVGRLDRIAYELYGYARMYKPLAVANLIALPHGYRVGVRKDIEAVRNELYQDGLRGSELERTVNDVMMSLDQTVYDWNSYGDVYYGIVSDCYEGRILQVPTFESANAWMLKYEYHGNVDDLNPRVI